MSNGWYQLEHNRPRKGVPYLPGGTPRREPYIPVTRSTASEPPIPERLPQEPPALSKLIIRDMKISCRNHFF